MTEQEMFRCYFWELVKNYSVEEVSKYTGFKIGYINQRIKNKKTNKIWHKEAIFHYYARHNICG